MTWSAHQGNGFFGFDSDGSPRWEEQVEIEAAMAEGRDIREAFFKWQALGAAPYSGGFLDAWPARMADGLSFCKREWAAVMAHVTALARKEANRG